MNINNNIKA